MTHREINISKIDPIAQKVCELLAVTEGKDKATEVMQMLKHYDRSEVFIWLSEQDNGLLYDLALDLDIPLQHLNHTCQTMKQLQQIHN